MTKFLLRFLALVAIAISARAELPIIAKARAYLGTEDALNRVQSIHYVGTLVSADATDKGTSQVEIFYQAPYQQRIEATSAKGTEITALDGYDGWQHAQAGNDPAKQRTTLLGPAQVKRLRANAWENLAFFRGIERAGGEVIDHGDATIQGVACRKVVFVHAKDIAFTRYFEKATGRLVLTETETGGTIREEGEIFANGIRFPKAITTDSKIPGGDSQKFTITFSSVTVNEKIPDSKFVAPILPSD